MWRFRWHPPLHELREADGKMSGLQLFAAGMRIGRDMIGTMSNTLILAFAVRL